MLRITLFADKNAPLLTQKLLLADLELLRLSCLLAEHSKNYSFVDICEMFEKTRQIVTVSRIDAMIKAKGTKAYYLLALLPKQLVEQYKKISDMSPAVREKKKSEDYQKFVDQFIDSALIQHLEEIKSSFLKNSKCQEHKEPQEIQAIQELLDSLESIKAISEPANLEDEEMTILPHSLP